jgi:heterotetrameric sarcosine oxidase gamma subunit
MSVSAPDAVDIAVAATDVVQVLARRDRAADLAAAMRTSFGLELPAPGHAVVVQNVTALWIQPDGFFLLAPRGPEGALAKSVKAACGDAASVIDQTHGRSVVTLSGARARWVLSKFCRVDLHPAGFRPGQAASTQIAHLACTIHQRDAVPSYDLIVFTTFLKSFLESLTHAAEHNGAASD